MASQRFSCLEATPAPDIDALLRAAFAQPRDPRSPEYRAGVRACLDKIFYGSPIKSPYLPGTAAFDAFCGGIAEGRELAKALNS